MWGNQHYPGYPPQSNVVFVPVPSQPNSLEDINKTLEFYENMKKKLKEEGKDKKEETKKSSMNSRDVAWILLLTSPITGPAMLKLYSVAAQSMLSSLQTIIR